VGEAEGEAEEGGVKPTVSGCHGAVSLGQRTYLCLYSRWCGWVCNMEGSSTDGGITSLLRQRTSTLAARGCGSTG
jgi:hypothetical protein